jgi:hypothetical protein
MKIEDFLISQDPDYVDPFDFLLNMNMIKEKLRHEE